MIKNLLDNDEDPSTDASTDSPTAPRREPAVMGLFDSADENAGRAAGPYDISPAPMESAAQTARRSGMAYSLGIAFFASVGFMLILGWGADLLFGSSPWGVVAGIVIGALIGFYQIFRISSQIFKS